MKYKEQEKKERKNIAYIRCSCDKSDVENQRYEILKFCEENELQIDEWVEETISGTTEYSTRKLGEALKGADKNTRFITCEISRIARKMFDIMEFLNRCTQKGCEVWTIKDNFRLGDDLSSKVIAFAFALSAEIERSLLSQRTKQSLARKKAEGIRLGRKVDYTRADEERAIALRKKGWSFQKIADETGISKSAVHRLCKNEGLE